MHRNPLRRTARRASAMVLALSLAGALAPGARAAGNASAIGDLERAAESGTRVPGTGTGAGGSAAVPTADAFGALAEARAAAERMSARADEIRADLTSGSFERAVTRLADMAGLDPAEITAAADLTAHSAPGVAGTTPPGLRTLPPALAAPIADLLGAATAAADGMQRAVDADGGASLELSRRADRLGHRIATALMRGERWPVDKARDLKAEVTASPVLRAAAAGGLRIGAALDRTLPRLRAAAATLSPTLPAGRRAEACDVLDERPYLCVNGPDANLIDAEAVLVIDLGGDDLYTSSAGGASSARCEDDDEPSCRTSVVVDLGGDDTYLVGDAIAHDHLVAGGSAMTGIGILVDAEGDDRYLARIPSRDERFDLSFVFGSAQLGLGLLADLGGDDRYEVTGEPIMYNPYLLGASLTGMGAVLDLGGANTYLVHKQGVHRPNPEAPLGANRTISTMATGIFGGAALVDRTGYATLDARIEATAGAQEELNTVGVIAHGVGLIGDAALFAGAGPTVYSARAHRVAEVTLPGQSEDLGEDEYGIPIPAARIPGHAGVTAQAVGALGFGVIDDAGGDDTYLAHARSEHHLTVTAEEGCGCDRALAILDVNGEIFDRAGAAISAQGLGSSIFVPDAGALIHDRGGDDTYTARAELIVTTRAENTLDDPSGGARAESVPYSASEVNAFGQGLGSDFAPSMILDASGDDTYELVAHASTDATADAGEGPASARALGALTATHGQGASYWDPAHGAVLDLGGRDRYEAHSTSRATTSPDPGAWDVARTIGVQGAVGGMLADLDDGLPSVFAATPEPGPGVGHRGEGPGWVDVSKTFPGYGIAPLQPAKADVVLSMDPQNPSTVKGWTPMRARLTDAAGAPLAGRELTFDIEIRTTPITGENWFPHRYRAHAVTDEDGWATGHLDFEEFVAHWGGDTSNLTLRVATRYEGDATTRPAMASQPITTTA